MRYQFSTNSCSILLRRYFSSYPSHLVVSMPALSPTMTHGTVQSWKKKVGDKCAPGDTIAEIETDKASMAFEGQDDFFIAKLLVEPGAEVAVGSPILISVEDESSIKAFEKYEAPTAGASTPVPPKVEMPPPVIQKVSPPPAVPIVSTPISNPTPIAPAVITPSPVPQITQSVAGTYSIRIKEPSQNISPLLAKLIKDKIEYDVKYGRGKEIKKENKSEKHKSKA